VDESQATAVRLGIKSIPTLLFFNGGERVHAIAGMVPFGTLEEAIKKVLAEKTMSAPFLVS
jgi:thioredoxin-like negative regulator of GroEL